jgi:hypothetical protein
MKRRVIFALGMALCLAWTVVAYAHTPICACYLNGDGTVTCEGGFSDGSSAAGVKMTVRTPDGAVIQEGKMDDLGEFIFDVPEGDYEVEFNAGPGHAVLIKGEEIQ